MGLRRAPDRAIKATVKLALAVLCSLWMASAVQALDHSTAPSKKPPVIGMTMSDALAYYGEPYRRAVVNGNATWFYYLKFAEVYGRAIVPFRFESDNVRLGSITFGPDKKIRSSDWQRLPRDLLTFR